MIEDGEGKLLSVGVEEIMRVERTTGGDSWPDCVWMCRFWIIEESDRMD